MRYPLICFSISSCPFDNLSAYLSALEASIEKSGFSPLCFQYSRRDLPQLQPDDGGSMPCQAGIVPSLFPAFSAPDGVSVFSSKDASAAADGRHTIKAIEATAAIKYIVRVECDVVR